MTYWWWLLLIPPPVEFNLWLFGEIELCLICKMSPPLSIMIKGGLMPLELA
jgi:hypothetical protein